MTTIRQPAALVEGRDAFLAEDAGEGVRDALVGHGAGFGLEELEAGLDDVDGVDGEGGGAAGDDAGEEGVVEDGVPAPVGAAWSGVVEVSEEGEVDDGEGHIAGHGGESSFVETPDSLGANEFSGDLGGGLLGSSLPARLLQLDLEQLHGRCDDDLTEAGAASSEHFSPDGQLSVLGLEVVAGRNRWRRV